MGIKIKNSKLIFKGSNVSESYIDCTINQALDLLDMSIKDALSIILEKIKGMGDKEVQEKLESAHYNIYDFYNKNKVDFVELSRLASCSLTKDPHSTQLQNIIEFWIIAKYYNPEMDMKSIVDSSGRFSICERNVWLFSPSNEVTTSIEKSIAALKYYFKVAQINNVNNGICCITKLKSKGVDCEECRREFIDKEDVNGIIDDFINGNIKFEDKAIQKDFMSIQFDKNLKIQCGNCISDVEEVPGNINTLTK